MFNRAVNGHSIAAFFSGAGGLDLGFKLAGFNVVWANEFDKSIWDTYSLNFPSSSLDRRSISEISPTDIPDVTGFIGGPPCQSWSEAGAGRGSEDARGQLFFRYVELISRKKPLFFQAENVSGILFSRHSKAFRSILESLASIGYNVSFGLLRASNYSVPQDRDRVFIVGYRSDLDCFFSAPEPHPKKQTLRDAIWDLRKSAKPFQSATEVNSNSLIQNHEYFVGGFSSMYMSRNRVRSWDEQSFTIQAGARHAPLHPQAPKMELVGKDQFQFKPGFEDLYRRLSVREAARIQTFPDDFHLVYQRVVDGYKMMGNAVPVSLARAIADRIMTDLLSINPSMKPPSGRKLKRGSICTFEELAQSQHRLPMSV